MSIVAVTVMTPPSSERFVAKPGRARPVGVRTGVTTGRLWAIASRDGATAASRTTASRIAWKSESLLRALDGKNADARFFAIVTTFVRSSCQFRTRPLPRRRREGNTWEQACVTFLRKCRGGGESARLTPMRVDPTDRQYPACSFPFAPPTGAILRTRRLSAGPIVSSSTAQRHRHDVPAQQLHHHRRTPVGHHPYRLRATRAHSASVPSFGMNAITPPAAGSPVRLPALAGPRPRAVRVPMRSPGTAHNQGVVHTRVQGTSNASPSPGAGATARPETRHVEEAHRMGG